MNTLDQTGGLSRPELKHYVEDLEKLLQQERRYLYVVAALSIVFTVAGIVIAILLLPRGTAHTQIAALVSLGGLSIGELSLFRVFTRSRTKNALLESAIERFQRNELDVEAREQLVSRLVSSL
jgi:hypothetical protein